MTLEQAKVGQPFTVLRVRGEGALRRRLLDMAPSLAPPSPSPGRLPWETPWS